MSGPERYRRACRAALCSSFWLSPATPAKCNYCCRDPLCSAPHKTIISHFSLGPLLRGLQCTVHPLRAPTSLSPPRPPPTSWGHHHLGSQALVPPGMGRHADRSPCPLPSFALSSIWIITEVHTTAKECTKPLPFCPSCGWTGKINQEERNPR